MCFGSQFYCFAFYCKKRTIIQGESFKKKHQKHQQGVGRETRGGPPLWQPFPGSEDGVGMGRDEGKSREINVRVREGGRLGWGCEGASKRRWKNSLPQTKSIRG